MKKLLLCLVAAASGTLVARADSFSVSTNSLNSLDHGYAYTWGIDATALKGAGGTNLANQLASGYVITGATITFKNIYNWDKKDTANQLFMHLLNDPKSGIKSVRDNPNDNGVNQGTVSDYFAGLAATNPTYDGKNKTYYNTTDGKFHSTPDNSKRWIAYGYDSKGKALTDGNYENIHLADYHDPYGLQSKRADFSYSFSAEQLALLQSYINDGDGTGSSRSDFGFGFDPDCHFYNSGIVFTVTTARYSVPDTAMTLVLLSLGLAGLGGYKRFFLRSLK